MEVINMKKWYQSKTLWVNLISLIAIGLHQTLNLELLTAEQQGTILAFINIVLRLITKEKIEWN